MANLGEQWRQQVGNAGTNSEILWNIVRQREELARAWVRQIQLQDLPDGIKSCISRGSDSLALPLPLQLVTSQAIREFMNTLSEKGLLSDIALDDQDPDTALLLIIPAL